MILKYSKHRQAIESMYEDLATISRYVEVEKDSGETRLSNEPVPIYVDQPCRISQKALATNNQSEAQNDIRYETKLFIFPDLGIRQGDVIFVTRGGITRSYTAGEPFLYPTHQEISIQRDGEA